MNAKVRRYVMLRDSGCVGRFANNPYYANEWPMLQGLPDHGVCRNEWGHAIRPDDTFGMQYDHVKDSLCMGKRAEDSRELGWTMCPWNHVQTSWATSRVVREAARAYIKAANDAADERGLPYEV